MRTFILLIASIFVFTLISCDDKDLGPDPLKLYEYSFDTDTEGWESDFADYPVGEEEFYELDFSHSTLPEPLDTTDGALVISGSNHSDDLFMLIKKQISGLEPNTEYEVYFDINLASDAADSSVGVGGSPATSVYLKAGVVDEEPGRIEDEGDYYRMDIDKGNQANEGEDMIVVGDMSNGTSEFEYSLISRGNEEPFLYTSDSTGTAWLLIGTDSGFEAITRPYYNEINVLFERSE